MKIRNGFISNSSSTSFIIASNSNINIVTFSITVDLNKYADHVFTTEEDVLEYFKEEWDGATNQNKITLKALEAIRSGKKVIVGTLTDENGDAVETMLCEGGLNNLEMPDGTEVIFSEAGY